MFNMVHNYVSKVIHNHAVPLITKLDVIPTYSINEDMQLLVILTKFTHSMVLNIVHGILLLCYYIMADITSGNLSEEIDESVHFYTINYTDSTFGTLCASVKISATSCLLGICKHVLKHSSVLITCPSSSRWSLCLVQIGLEWDHIQILPLQVF